MSSKQDRQSFKNNKFSDSLKYAIEGLKTVIVEERNMKFHFIFGILVIITTLFLPLNTIEFLWILFAIVLVWITEMYNTIIENIIDLVQPDYHPLAKKIKDIAAGAVLLSSVFSVITGLIIILPILINWLF